MMQQPWTASFLCQRLSALALALVAVGALSGCNGASPTDCPGGTVVNDGARSFCVLPRLITETGFLCPEAYPEGYDAGDATVCAATGDDPEASAEELCAVLDLAYDADANVCRSEDGEEVPFVPVDSDPHSDAGSPDEDAGSPGTDAGSPDTSEPDAIVTDVTEDTLPDTVGPDASEPDAIDPDTSGPDVMDPEAGVPDAGDPQSCSSEELTCPEGSLCVQRDPDVCSDAWTGACEVLDPGAICPEVAVCGCDGQVFGNACAARESGYNEVFTTCPAVASCADDASSCEDGCLEMRAFPFDEDAGCVDYASGSIVVGCREDAGGTDDAPCVQRRRDGALFIATSGSGFGSGSWSYCDEETSGRVGSAPDCGE